MAYQDSLLQALSEKYHRLDRYISVMMQNRWSRFWGIFTHLFYSTIFMPPLLISAKFVSVLLPNKGRSFEAWLLKRYFKYYFYKRHIYTTFITPPINIMPGSLILTTRTHNHLLPMYHYTLFTTNIIAPVLPFLYRFKGILFPFNLIGKLMKRVTYPDGPLAQQQTILKALLQQGYRVMVNINPDFLDPLTDDLLYIDPTIQSLIAVANETYLLHAANFEAYQTSSVNTPLVTIVSCKSLDSVLHDPNTILSDQNLNSVSNFFKYKKSELRS